LNNSNSGSSASSISILALNFDACDRPTENQTLPPKDQLALFQQAMPVVSSVVRQLREGPNQERIQTQSRIVLNLLQIGNPFDLYKIAESGCLNDIQRFKLPDLQFNFTLMEWAIYFGRFKLFKTLLNEQYTLFHCNDLDSPILGVLQPGSENYLAAIFVNNDTQNSIAYLQYKARDLFKAKIEMLDAEDPELELFKIQSELINLSIQRSDFYSANPEYAPLDKIEKEDASRFANVDIPERTRNVLCYDTAYLEVLRLLVQSGNEVLMLLPFKDSYDMAINKSKSNKSDGQLTLQRILMLKLQNNSKMKRMQLPQPKPLLQHQKD